MNDACQVLSQRNSKDTHPGCRPGPSSTPPKRSSLIPIRHRDVPKEFKLDAELTQELKKGQDLETSLMKSWNKRSEQRTIIKSLKIPFVITSKGIKYLGTHLTNEVRVLRTWKTRKHCREKLKIQTCSFRGSEDAIL